MAVKRVRFCRVTDDGTTTTFHLETSSDIVMRPDGTSVEQALKTLAAGGGSSGGSSGGGASAAEIAELKDQINKLATAAVNHVDKEVLNAFKTEMTTALSGKANVQKATKFTIAANAWVTDATEGYPYYFNIPAPGVTAATIAEVVISPASVDIATAAGFCPTVETIAGAVRVRVKNVPTNVITGEYRI